MKVFQFLQKQFAFVGITISSKQSTIFNTFNGRVAFGFILNGCAIVEQSMYVIHVANGFMEYMECINSASGTIIIFVWYAAIALKKATLFEIIDKFEKLIDTSEGSSDSR